MALYSIRSERQISERLQYDLLFRWFLDLKLDETKFDHSTYSQKPNRLLLWSTLRVVAALLGLEVRPAVPIAATTVAVMPSSA